MNTLREGNEAEIRELLLGHRIVGAETGSFDLPESHWAMLGPDDQADALPLGVDQ